MRQEHEKTLNVIVRSLKNDLHDKGGRLMYDNSKNDDIFQTIAWRNSYLHALLNKFVIA